VHNVRTENHALNAKGPVRDTLEKTNKSSRPRFEPRPPDEGIFVVDWTAASGQVSDAELAAVNPSRHSFREDWNCDRSNQKLYELFMHNA
jgi:hypothetical protein